MKLTEIEETVNGSLFSCWLDTVGNRSSPASSVGSLHHGVEGIYVEEYQERRQTQGELGPQVRCAEQRMAEVQG